VESFAKTGDDIKPTLKHYETNSVRTPTTRQGLSNGIKSQEHGKRHCGLGDLNVTNKTNKLPSINDRF